VGRAELCSDRTVAGRFGNPLSVSFHSRREGRALLGPDHRGKVWKPLSAFPSIRVGRAELCSDRTFAGRFGNPSQRFLPFAWEGPSSARTGPSREGLETPLSFSFHSRGEGRALLGPDHRGKVWKPLSAFPSTRVGRAELCSDRTIAGRFGNPLRVSIQIDVVSKVINPSFASRTINQGVKPCFSGEFGLRGQRSITR